jgi:aminoglycoside 2'-N-acetyltransferase I
MSEPEIVVARTDELSEDVLVELRALMDLAFDEPDHPDEAFTDDDWEHALGGTHVMLVDPGGVIGETVVAHASVVDRIIDVGGRPLRAGYVEAVATRPAFEGRGLGSRVMARVDDVIRERHQLGALATGAFRFYERLGWERWQGPSFVRHGDEIVRSADDDDAIMVLRVDPALVPDRTAPISCDDRPGDAW